MLADGLNRSREGHLGLPYRDGKGDPVPPALMRKWSADGSWPVANAMLTARIGMDTRLQLYDTELLADVSIALDNGMAVVRDHRAKEVLFTLWRPGAPTFEAQTKRVESWAVLRAERTSEILSQLGPQFEYWSSIASLGLASSPYTRELILAAMGFTSRVVQRLKYLLPVPRPAEMSARVQPMIEAPAFFAYPSGHATQAFMVAKLLSLLLRKGNAVSALEELEVQLYRQAERIATNRVVAGVHYPIDSLAGCALGLTLAEYFAARCGLASDVRPRGLVPDTASKLQLHSADFDPRLERGAGGVIHVTPAPGMAPLQSVPIANRSTEALSWLYSMAEREWTFADPPKTKGRP